MSVFTSAGELAQQRRLKGHGSHQAAHECSRDAGAGHVLPGKQQAMHGLSARIVCRTEASPLTFRRYDWSSAGAIYGKSGAAVATKSPIPGLVFAGAARQGAGIEVVVISGASAAEALVPELLRTPAKSA